MNKLLLLSVGIFLTGCVNQASKPAPPAQLSGDQPTEVVSQTQPTGKIYSLTEVSQHNQANDCWLAIDGKVYDVSRFTQDHPGKEAILAGCGKNATELYNTRPMGSKTPHSEKAREKLKEFYIGQLGS